MQSFLRNRDLFGHPVQLNFNKGGPEHNTVYGGVASLVVKVLMLVYVGKLITRMLMFEDDEIVSSISLNDNDHNDGLKMSEMSRIQFYRVTS